jgi:hypothetical protein
MAAANFNPNPPLSTAVTSLPGELKGGSSSEMTLFDIPKDLVCELFSRLALDDLKNVSLTCKALRCISIRSQAFFT